MSNDDGILRRRMTPWNQRRTYFSKALTFAAAQHTLPTPLSHILDYVVSHRYQQVMLTGGHDAAHTPERAYWMEPVASGWSIERYVPEPRSCVYVRLLPDGSHDRITVRMSAAWYDDCQNTALIEHTHTLLLLLLKNAFDRGVTLFGTPSRTGQDLLLRSLPERKLPNGERVPYEYLPTPAEVRDILEHNFGQGRKEFVAPEGAPPLTQMFLFDARWMYAAHCRGLPTLVSGGPPLVSDDGCDFEAHRPGFYRVTFRAPEGWPHIGLLPSWDVYDHKTVWPVDSYFWRIGWVTEPELRLAIATGWDVRIRERLLFAPDSTPGSDLARQWIEKLIRLRTQAQREITPESPLLAAALRNIVIGTVGAWKRSDHRELHVTLPGHEREIPDDALDIKPIYADNTKPSDDTLVRIEWFSRGKLDSIQTPMHRPEWSIGVWGSARRAIAEEALKYPRAWEIALRSDALALRQMVPFDDDGKPGRFRLKKDWHFETPQATPRDETSWRKLTGGEE